MRGDILYELKKSIFNYTICHFGKWRRENRVDSGILVGSSSSHARIPLHKNALAGLDGWPGRERTTVKDHQLKRSINLAFLKHFP